MTMSDDVCGVGGWVGQNVSRECWDMLRHVCRWVLKKEKRSDIGSFFLSFSFSTFINFVCSYIFVILLLLIPSNVH